VAVVRGEQGGISRSATARMKDALRKGDGLVKKRLMKDVLRDDKWFGQGCSRENQVSCGYRSGCRRGIEKWIEFMTKTKEVGVAGMVDEE
jgi:hypothetical protein